MSNVTLTEPRPVAKKETKAPTPPVRDEDDEPQDLRIEFVCSDGFLKRLDRARKPLGLNRSAYIRMACNKLMAGNCT